jgi:hypothetical protein
MILYYSTYLRIFSADGFRRDKIVLLKLINNNSIKNLFNILKTMNLNLSMDVYYNLIKNFLLDLPIISMRQSDKIIKKYFKAFLIFYLFKFYVFRTRSKYIYFLKKNINSIKILKYISLYNDDKKSIDPSILVPGEIKRKYGYHFYKNKKYSKTNRFKDRSYFLDMIENINNKNIFVIGNVLDFYRGSVTCLYGARYNWLVSTGLKSDVECNNLEIRSNFFQKKLWEKGLFEKTRRFIKKREKLHRQKISYKGKRNLKYLNLNRNAFKKDKKDFILPKKWDQLMNEHQRYKIEQTLLDSYKYFIKNIEEETERYNDFESENYDLNSIFIDKSKDVVFRVHNFKKTITNVSKPTVRYCFLYNIKQFYGFERFVGENKSTFVYKKNKIKLFIDFFFYNNNLTNSLVDNIFFSKSFYIDFYNNKFHQFSFYTDFYNRNFHQFSFLGINFQTGKLFLILFKSFSNF